MIIVVEGISASGKTTWHTRNSGYHLVAENGPRPDAPDAVQDPWGGGGRYEPRSSLPGTRFGPALIRL
jgi:hypothetical protein